MLRPPHPPPYQFLGYLSASGPSEWAQTDYIMAAVADLMQQFTCQ